MPTDPNALLATLEADLARTEAKARRATIVGSCLIVFAFGYMGWIYGQIAKLDAAAVADIATHEVIEHLPSVRESLERQAIEMAPHLIGEGQKMALAMPKTLRQQAEGILDEMAKPKLKELEMQANATLDQVMAGALKDLATVAQETTTKPTTPDAQATQIAADLRAAFKGEMDRWIAHVHTGYRTRMNDVVVYLQKLQQKNLTERQKIEKQLVQASLALFKDFKLEPLPVDVRSEEAHAQR